MTRVVTRPWLRRLPWLALAGLVATSLPGVMAAAEHHESAHDAAPVADHQTHAADHASLGATHAVPAVEHAVSAPAQHADSAPHPAPSATTAAPVATPSAHGGSALTGRQALDLLLAGNRRFVADVVSWSHRGSDRRIEIAKGQHPIAVIVCCSDSRVPPELVFDQGMGDLFVVRTAGNVVDAVALGSIEYACEHLHVSLVLVLGHERCGAVTAAVGRDTPSGQVRAVVDHIRRNLKGQAMAPADAVEQAVQTNARAVAQTIADCGPIIAGFVRSEDVVVVAARYDLESGDVTVLP